jgi:hypothetical protein
MAKCRIRHRCRTISRLLRRLDPDAVSELQQCDAKAPCQQAVDTALMVHHHINPENAELVGAAIQKIFDGKLPIDQTTNSLVVLQKPPFMCPEIGLEIRQPCSVQSCSFWTDKSWTRNCILYYMHERDRDSLDLKEMTILLGDATGSIRKRLNDLVVQVRRNAMMLKTQQAAQDMVEPENSACATCGVEISGTPVLHGDVLYCSETCAPVRSSVELQLEADFHLPAARVLAICMSNFFGLRHICHALNITTKQFQRLCADHEIDIQHLL